MRLFSKQVHNKPDIVEDKKIGDKHTSYRVMYLVVIILTKNHIATHQNVYQESNPSH